MTDARAIGGVMAAAPSGAPVSDSLGTAWAATFTRTTAFANARSALAAVLRRRGCGTAWLPAYGCQSLLDGAAAGADRVCFYSVTGDLDLADETWASGLGARDAVVVVDYFGRAPGEAWRRLRERRPAALWIEDRAQALATAAPPLGDVVIYSPRKLVGVGDGGLAFSSGELPEPQAPGDDARWAPEDARADDPEGRAPERWRPLFQAREAAAGVGGAGASPRTLAALNSIALAPIAERRRDNWRRLAQRLGDYALWPIEAPAFAPLAFPILAEDAAAAVAALAGARIWAPRHWADPPSPAAEFPEAHWLAAHCVSLPLDQRYGEGDMDRIAAMVRARVRPARRPSSGSRRPVPRSRHA